MRVDLHVHTRYSGHSLLSVEHVAELAKKRGLGAVAITDHDEIQGAIELSRVFPTIVGEEVSSYEGDVIGLFLREKVAKDSALEVMDRIRAQGGLVMIPHPFDRLRRESLIREDLCRRGDIIEIFNSRVVLARDNERARRFAELEGIPAAVGSDAHTATEIGRSWVELESVDDPKAFMRSLSDAYFHQEKSPIFVHLQTEILKLRNISITNLTHTFAYDYRVEPFC